MESDSFLSDVGSSIKEPSMNSYDKVTSLEKDQNASLGEDDFLYFYTSEREDYTIQNTINRLNGSTNDSSVVVDIRDEDLARIEITIQAVILILSIVGNSLLILALRYRKKKTSRMHMYILHLSIADLLVALCNILPQLAWDITFRFQGNDLLCRLVKYLQIMVIYLSTYILVATAVDRYRSICNPLSVYNWSSKKVYLTIGIAWCLSFILALPQLFIFKKTEIRPGIEDCWAEFRPEWTVTVYITSFAVTVYLVPFLLLALLYGRICFEVCKNFNTERKFPLVGYKSNSGGIIYKFNGSGHISVIGHSESGSSGTKSGQRESRRHTSHKTISRSKLKTVKLTFVVVIAYLVCWAPFIITQMWWAYDDTAPYNNATFVICLLLASLNSCVNPWIYMAFSGNLLKHLFPCCSWCKNRCPKPRLNHRVPSVEEINQKADNGGKRKEQLDDKLLDKSNKVSAAKARLSNLKNTLFSRSQSTKITGTSDNAKYRVRRCSRDKDIANMVALKSSENGLRINRVNNGAGTNYQYRDFHHNVIGNHMKGKSVPYFYHNTNHRKQEVKHTSV